MEIWKDIAHFDGYQISNNGTVRSFRPRNGIGSLKSMPHVLKPQISKKGHLRVPLRRDGRVYKRFVHILVLEAFVECKPKGMECRHVDGNSTNNFVCNLKWGTSIENRHDRILHGTHNEGEAHGMVILSEENIFEIKELLRQRNTHQSIADIFDVDRSTITKINIGKNWKYLNK